MLLCRLGFASPEEDPSQRLMKLNPTCTNRVRGFILFRIGLSTFVLFRISIFVDLLRGFEIVQIIVDQGIPKSKNPVRCLFKLPKNIETSLKFISWEQSACVDATRKEVPRGHPATEHTV